MSSRDPHKGGSEVTLPGRGGGSGGPKNRGKKIGLRARPRARGVIDLKRKPARATLGNLVEHKTTSQSAEPMLGDQAGVKKPPEIKRGQITNALGSEFCWTRIKAVGMLVKGFFQTGAMARTKETRGTVTIVNPHCTGEPGRSGGGPNRMMGSVRGPAGLKTNNVKIKFLFRLPIQKNNTVLQDSVLKT